MKTFIIISTYSAILLAGCTSTEQISLRYASFHALIQELSSESGKTENWINGNEEQIEPDILTEKDSTMVTVIFSSVIEKGNGYIVISWQEKVVRLDSSEYISQGETEDGQLFIIVPNDIYNRKFK